MPNDPSKGAPPEMKSSLCGPTCLAALLSLPAVAHAAGTAQAAALQLDPGALGLLGAGLVALAIGHRWRRRS